MTNTNVTDTGNTNATTAIAREEEKRLILDWVEAGFEQLDRLDFANGLIEELADDGLLSLTHSVISALLTEMDSNLSTLKKRLEPDDLTIEEGVERINMHLRGIELFQLIIEHCTAAYNEMPAASKTMRGIKLLADLDAMLKIEDGIALRQTVKNIFDRVTEYDPKPTYETEMKEITEQIREIRERRTNGSKA